MILTLSTRAGTPGAGAPPGPLSIDQRGASIGRALECDLVLPDPHSLISRKHCRIDFSGGTYVLTDSSTGGTTVNGRRLTAPRPLATGDVIGIGPYQIGVQMTVAARSAPVAGQQPRPAAPAVPQSATILATAPQPGGGDAVTQLLAACGLARGAVPIPDAAVLAAAGALLRQLIAGMAAMLAARAKARGELGVREAAADPRNPFQPGAAPEAIAGALLRAGPAGAPPAIAAMQAALDAHSHATLLAMQGALARTLETLAPAAIRARTKGGDAACWKAYETAFTGTGGEADFIEHFARDLGTAYERLAATPTSPRG